MGGEHVCRSCDALVGTLHQLGCPLGVGRDDPVVTEMDALLNPMPQAAVRVDALTDARSMLAAAVPLNLNVLAREERVALARAQAALAVAEELRALRVALEDLPRAITQGIWEGMRQR